MTPTFRLGRVAGIEVELHWSVLVVMTLIVWGLADVTLPDLAPGYADGVYWVVGVLTAVLMFTSLLAHELAHSVVARRLGVGVERITLWLLGGVSQLHGEAATPRAELRIAGAGPLTSVGLGATFGVLALVVDGLGGPPLAVAAIGWLAVVNGVLAAFNLLPGAPLDGGRLLHARVWDRTGDRATATRVATRTGAGIGYALIGLGLLLLVLGDLASVWFVLLGWFLLSAAQAEATHALLHAALARVRVTDVMTAHPTTVGAGTSVDDLVERMLSRDGHAAYPVVDARGVLTGVVTLTKVRSVPPERRASVDAGTIAEPRASVPNAVPDEPLADALERAGRSVAGGGRILVLDGDELVGIVAPSDVQRAVDLAALRAPKPDRADRREAQHS